MTEDSNIGFVLRDLKEFRGFLVVKNRSLTTAAYLYDGMNSTNSNIYVLKSRPDTDRSRAQGSRPQDGDTYKQPRRKQPKRGAAQPAFKPDSPEHRLRMKRTDALDLFEPLPLPPSWRVYITAPTGEVAARMPGCGRLLRAALLLQELGTVQLAQRRTEHGTEYLIRRSFR